MPSSGFCDAAGGEILEQPRICQARQRKEKVFFGGRKHRLVQYGVRDERLNHGIKSG